MAIPELDPEIHIDLSGPGFDPIEQGIDYGFEIAFGLDDPLEATDKFLMQFRETLNGKVLGKLGEEQFILDMTTRELRVVVDGNKTRPWFKGEEVTAENRIRPVYSKFRHTDSAGNDRDSSGLNCKFGFKIGLLRDGT